MSIILTLSPGQSQKITVSTTSTQSAPIDSTSCTIYSDVDCYVRQGAAPVALSNGSDQFIPAGTFLRLEGITRGNKLGIIGAAAGTVFLTPGA